VYTRASPTDILVRKSACVGQKSADKSARIVVRVRLVASAPGQSACRADFRARRTRRRLPREDPREEVGEEVRVVVSVRVRVGPVEFKLICTKTVTHPSTNRARRKVTSFMRRMTLPLRQTADGRDAARRAVRLCQLRVDRQLWCDDVVCVERSMLWSSTWKNMTASLDRYTCCSAYTHSTCSAL